jgi:aminocarboxymuconate-semialdehyde decarboxylase
LFKIDIHTHILPENLNEVTGRFSDSRFLKLYPVNDTSAVLKKDEIAFRHVHCNCWNHKVRIEDCDSNRVNMQVLSTLPVLFSYWAKDNECLSLSKALNDHIVEICKIEPQRFIGIGTIPMQNTNYAIQEMDRCINDLKLPGIQIGSNINGKNLSDIKFQPIFEHAEKIDCSIFIHPWEMMGQADMQKYWLPWLVGMPAETSRAICSIIFGGILEKYPNLKIAFAHGGGAFPFIIGRIDHGHKMRPDICAVDNKKIPSSYFKYFYVDSLVHDEQALHFLLNKIGPEHIALGSDYPFPLGEQEPGRLIEEMDLTDSVKQRILSGTAFEWLGIDEKNYIGV